VEWSKKEGELSCYRCERNNHTAYQWTSYTCHSCNKKGPVAPRDREDKQEARHFPNDQSKELRRKK